MPTIKQKFADAAEAAGIPDSPILREEREDAPASPILDLHVGGIPVRELSLEAQGRILYQQTDEGIAQANAGKEPRRVQILSDELSKGLEHRRDAVKDFGMNLGDAPNTMREQMDKHIAPGMKGRWLSPRVVDRRGLRGWEPVLDAEGKNIKVGNLFLGQMSAESAKLRNKKVREYGNKLLGQVKENYLAEGGKTALVDQD